MCRNSRTSIARTTARLSWNSSTDDFWANCTNWWHVSSFTVVQRHLFTSLIILAFLPYPRDTDLLSLFFFFFKFSFTDFTANHQARSQHLHTHSITGLLCSTTLTKTHRDEQEPTGAVLPTQRVSSVGSRVPGLSQGVGLRLRQPLPCPHCYCTGSSVHIVPSADGEKNGQLEKCRRRRGIQMQPAPRSFYLDQYCPASSGSAHKAEEAGGLLNATVIHLGCCGLWPVNTVFFFLSHDLGGGEKKFIFSEEEQQTLHLWLWPESCCYHLAATFGHCTLCLNHSIQPLFFFF